MLLKLCTCFIASVIISGCGRGSSQSSSHPEPGTNPIRKSQLTAAHAESFEGTYELLAITRNDNQCSEEGVEQPDNIGYDFRRYLIEANELKYDGCEDKACKKKIVYSGINAKTFENEKWLYPIGAYICGRYPRVSKHYVLEFIRKEIYLTADGVNEAEFRYHLEKPQFDCERIKEFVAEHEKDFACVKTLSTEKWKRVSN